MNKKEKFEGFLESIKGNGQDVLIESIKRGFQTCFESIMHGNQDVDKEAGEINKMMNSLVYKLQDFNEKLKKKDNDKFLNGKKVDAINTLLSLDETRQEWMKIFKELFHYREKWR